MPVVVPASTYEQVPMVPPIRTGWPTARKSSGRSAWPGPQARVAPLRWTKRRLRRPPVSCSSTLQVLCETS